MNRRRLIVTAASALAAPALGWAETGPASLSGAPTPSPLFETAGSVIRTRFADPMGGVDHRAWLLLPDRAAPATGWPLFCALDGVAVAEALTTAPQDRALLLLGHDQPDRFALMERTRDYTPPDANGQPVPDPMGRPGGGAAQYLAFLQTLVLPRMAELAPLDPQTRTLWGHSYGGVFTLFTAFSEQSPFTHHIAASPSLWWNRGDFWRSLLGQLDQSPPRTRIDTHSGTIEYSRPRSDITPQMQPMIEMRALTPDDAVDQLAAKMRAVGVPGTDLRFPGLAHGPAFAASLGAALEPRS